MAIKAADFATQLLAGIGGRIIHIFTTNKPYQPADPSRPLLNQQFNSCHQLANRCTKNSISYSMFLITEQFSVLMQSHTDSTHPG